MDPVSAVLPKNLRRIFVANLSTGHQQGSQEGNQRFGQRQMFSDLRDEASIWRGMRKISCAGFGRNQLSGFVDGNWKTRKIFDGIKSFCHRSGIMLPQILFNFN